MILSQTGCVGNSEDWSFTVIGHTQVLINIEDEVTGVISDDKSQIQWSNGYTYTRSDVRIS